MSGLRTVFSHHFSHLQVLKAAPWCPPSTPWRPSTTHSHSSKWTSSWRLCVRMQKIPTPGQPEVMPIAPLNIRTILGQSQLFWYWNTILQCHNYMCLPPSCSSLSHVWLPEPAHWGLLHPSQSAVLLCFNAPALWSATLVWVLLPLATSHGQNSLRTRPLCQHVTYGGWIRCTIDI